MATHRIQLAPLAWAFAIVSACFGILPNSSNGQNPQNTDRPFIGFRSFDNFTDSAIANAPNRNVAFPSNNLLGNNANSTNERAGAAKPQSIYPYPAGPNVGSLGNSRSLTPERTVLSSRLSGIRIPTGSLNRSLAPSTIPLAGNDPDLDRRYQQELQQRQSQQLQYQQYQLWQQQQRTQQQRFAQQNVASRQQPTLAKRPARQTDTASTPPASINFQTQPKLNQAVVQQVGSTATSSRDSGVARADFESQRTPLADRITTARANPATNTAAKPQCCCVPTNCCPPTAAAAQAFRPQAANQIPSLNSGSAAPASFGFLGQNSAGYQAQAQSGYQFQPGLGVPQFASTGSYGNGGWFSNLVRGTGAYRPLIPLEPLYPNARPGRGIIGQPTAYIDGQPIRNLLRYLMP